LFSEPESHGFTHVEARRVDRKQIAISLFKWSAGEPSKPLAMSAIWKFDIQQALGSIMKGDHRLHAEYSRGDSGLSREEFKPFTD